MTRRGFNFFIFNFRILKFTLTAIALFLYSPAHSELSFTSNTSLDSFDYDLDNIHLKLEKLNTRWEFSPFKEEQLQNNKLKVQHLKAKRLTITLKSNPQQTESSSPLPEKINLPFPISIAQAEIGEIIIISQSNNTQNKLQQDKRQTLNNVQFNFEGDAKSLRLQLSHADTPWGETAAKLNVGAAKPFPLTGNIAVKQSNGRNPYDLTMQLAGDLNALHFESNAWVSLQNGKSMVQLTSTEPTQAAAKLLLAGELSLNNDYPINIHAQIIDMHPERLGDYPAARLNLDINLNGTLQPTPTATLKIVTRDSEWRNQTVSFSANAQTNGTEISQLDFQMKLAENHIQGSGSLGAANSQFSWQANLADLSAFDKNYAGKADFKGSLNGASDNLLLQFNLAAEKLRLASDLKIEQLSGKVALNLGDYHKNLNRNLSSNTGNVNRKITGEFKAVAIDYGQYSAVNAEAILQGSQENHQLVITAQGQDVKLQTSIQGGLSAKNTSEKMQWQGFLQKLDFSGKTPIKLIDPAALAIDSNTITLGKTVLQLANGRATIEQLHLADHQLLSKGQLEKITLEDLPAGLFKLPDALHGSPVFSGKWDIAADESLNGNISIWRDTGDFTFNKIDGSLSPLGLTEAKIELNIKNNHAELLTKLEGQNLGNLNLTLATTVNKSEAGFQLNKDSPLNLKASANLNTLAWLPMPSGLLDANLEGQFNLYVTANGTLGAPNLNGNLNGKQLSFSLPSEGVAFTNGILQATFENNRLNIQQASWQGGEGTLNTSGWVLFDQGKPSIDLDWTAEKFTALSRTDRLLILSGSGKTTLNDNLLSILGSFTVNKGVIELVNEDIPALGDDVVVLGKTSNIQAPQLQILLNGLQINLGDDFTLQGSGLNAKLTGALTLNGLTQYQPHTQGTIQVASGTFMAYGQVLTIERGILSFKGPIDNPGLNIRAMRNSKPTNAGVEITGSAFAPVTKLVSDPDVPETEKLSWLVLGHGIDQAGKNDFAMLSLAAGALFTQGQSVPLQTQLARAAGLDEFSFAGSDAESASLTFGKRLSSRLYLSYAKSITGLVDVARLTFNMTPRWSLLAEAGTESAVDVLYTFSFK